MYQNTAEILALAVLNGICAILGALQVVDGVKWLNALSKTEYSTMHLLTAMRFEIALSVVIMLFACAMSYLSYGMSRQFGWNIYKKIGADVQMQSKSVPPPSPPCPTRARATVGTILIHVLSIEMYRMFQFFVLALKIDIFTEFLVSLFYVIQFGLKLDSVKWEVGIQVAVTILILPMLYFARTAVSDLFFTALSKKENVLI